MDALQEARKIINEVDEQMAALFCRRMEAAAMVAAYKKETGMPILDAAREEAVIRQGLERIGRTRRRYAKGLLFHPHTHRIVCADILQDSR